MISTEEEYEPLTSANNGNQGNVCGEDTNSTNADNAVSDEDDDAGCANYRQPNRFRTGRYSGYCTLGGGNGGSFRVSMHDSWDFDANREEDDNNEAHTSAAADSDGDDENSNGDFISFWRHDSDGDDGESSCSSSVANKRPQHPERCCVAHCIQYQY